MGLGPLVEGGEDVGEAIPVRRPRREVIEDEAVGLHVVHVGHRRSRPAEPPQAVGLGGEQVGDGGRLQLDHPLADPDHDADLAAVEAHHGGGGGRARELPRAGLEAHVQRASQASSASSSSR